MQYRLKVKQRELAKSSEPKVMQNIPISALTLSYWQHACLQTVTCIAKSRIDFTCAPSVHWFHLFMLLPMAEQTMCMCLSDF